MIHKMKLQTKPFDLIKNKEKTIELRLNDEKRQLLKELDYIEFTNEQTKEKIYTQIIKLHKFPNFNDLYKNFDKKLLGYSKFEIANYKDMEEYYPLSKQEIYGVLGIEIKVTTLYEIIKNDSYILDIYNQIKENEEKNMNWAYHDYNHALNVTNLIKEILTTLNYEKDIIESSMIAGIMHDIGALEGKENHALRSYERARNYFTSNEMDFKYKEDVLDAIKNHSNGFETDNIIRLVLILADKLDIKKNRVCNGGYLQEGMRQLSNIEDIKIELAEKTLKINFITTNNINIKELNEFYFTKKVFQAIKVFSTKLDLEYIILMNNNTWIII